METSKSKLDYIQALRCFAVLLVVLHHYRGGLHIAVHGYAGVDLFFVISGFLMVITTQGLKNPAHDAWVFIVKRVTRIWPVYSVLTTLFIFTMMPALWADPVPAVKWYIKSIVLWPLSATNPILPSAWPLTFGMLFYGIFALSILAGRFRWAAFFGVVALVMFALPLAFGLSPSLFRIAGFEGSGWQAWAAVASDPINWCFSIGVIVGLISLQKITVKSPSLLLLNMAPWTILLSWLLYVEPVAHGIVWGVTFGFIVLFLDLWNNTRPIQIPRCFVLLGDMSFSIYLVHDFAIVLAERYAFPRFDTVTTIGYLAVPYLYGTIVAGWVSYRLLELGLAPRVRGLLLRQPPPVINWPAKWEPSETEVRLVPNPAWQLAR